MSDLLELLNLLTVTDWVETRSGFYYNGKGYTDVLESRVTVSIPDGVSELAIIGDYWNDIGRARIQLDGSDAGEIHDSLLPTYNTNKLKYASRAYRTLLGYVNVPTSGSHTLSVEVTEGEITLAAFLIDQTVITYDTDSERSDIVNVQALMDPNYQNVNNNNDGGLSPGGTAAVVIVVLIVVAIVAVGIFLYIKRPSFFQDILDKLRRKRQNSSSGGQHAFY